MPADPESFPVGVVEAVPDGSLSLHVQIYVYM
jgi:hypothetical protein